MGVPRERHNPDMRCRPHRYRLLLSLQCYATGRFLVDCGLFQGPKTLKALNYDAFPFHPADIDAVLLTHAHIDHSGLLPKLKREGFSGPILATRGTIDLCSYMLPDAGNIQETEVAALNRRNAARGRPVVTPIYTQADAIATLDAFRPVEYQSWCHGDTGCARPLLERGPSAWFGFHRDRIRRSRQQRKALACLDVGRHRPGRQTAGARSGGPD